VAHIQVPEGVPGIPGPMGISAESAQALRANSRTFSCVALTL
jgi:hypothetical protein